MMFFLGRDWELRGSLTFVQTSCLKHLNLAEHAKEEGASSCNESLASTRKVTKKNPKGQYVGIFEVPRAPALPAQHSNHSRVLEGTQTTSWKDECASSKLFENRSFWRTMCTRLAHLNASKHCLVRFQFQTARKVRNSRPMVEKASNARQELSMLDSKFAEACDFFCFPYSTPDKAVTSQDKHIPNV